MLGWLCRNSQVLIWGQFPFLIGLISSSPNKPRDGRTKVGSFVSTARLTQEKANDSRVQLNCVHTTGISFKSLQQNKRVRNHWQWGGRVLVSGIRIFKVGIIFSLNWRQKSTKNKTYRFPQLAQEGLILINSAEKANFYHLRHQNSMLQQMLPFTFHCLKQFPECWFFNFLQHAAEIRATSTWADCQKSSTAAPTPAQSYGMFSHIDLSLEFHPYMLKCAQL